MADQAGQVLALWKRAQDGMVRRLAEDFQNADGATGVLGGPSQDHFQILQAHQSGAGKRRQDPARLEEVFRERPAIHRFPGSMARRVQNSANPMPVALP